jgi:hypothetical protein
LSEALFTKRSEVKKRERKAEKLPKNYLLFLKKFFTISEHSFSKIPETISVLG